MHLLDETVWSKSTRCTYLVHSLLLPVESPSDRDDAGGVIYSEPLVVSTGRQKREVPLASILRTLHHNSCYIPSNPYVLWNIEKQHYGWQFEREITDTVHMEMKVNFH